MRTEVSHTEMTIAIRASQPFHSQQGIIMSQFYLVAPSEPSASRRRPGVERLQQAGHEVAHQQVIPAGSSVSPGLNMNGWPMCANWPSCPAAAPGLVLAVRGGYGAGRLPHIRLAGTGCPPAARPAADLRPTAISPLSSRACWP